MSELRNGLTLELSCVVEAPRERVFDLLTKPDELVKWWGPQGFTTPEAEVRPECRRWIPVHHAAARG